MRTIKLTPIQKPVRTTVDIPGSKSVTNRALIMAALTKSSVKIVNPLQSDDTEAMVECLEKLGIEIDCQGHDVIVTGSIDDVSEGNYDLNARLSGTTIRFILALSCIVPGLKTVCGNGRLNERPLHDLVDGLRQMGADIVYKEKEGYPPVCVRTSDLQENSVVRMSGDVSSQYFSALMMVAPYVGGMTIEVVGSQISKSYIDITIQMMKEWGITVKNDSYEQYIIPSGKYKMRTYLVEGDYSAAGYFAAIAALTGSTIGLNNLQKDSDQGDKEFLHILEQMGNRITFKKNRVIVQGKGVKPVEVNMENCPDQAQTLAVLAAFADGKTVMTGVRSLRVKETERVQAVCRELGKMGVKAESPDEDTLIIHGGEPKPAMIDTYDDHRMAMSFAVAGARIPGLVIRDPQVVEKTFPEYWDKLKKLD